MVSPDKSRVAYLIQRGHCFDVGVSDADENGLPRAGTQRVVLADDRENYYLAWSPDGTQLVCASLPAKSGGGARDNSPHRVCSVNADVATAAAAKHVVLTHESWVLGTDWSR